MSDETGHRDTRKIAIYLVACFLIGVMGVVAGAHLANSVHVSGGVPIGAPDGLVVTVDGTTQMDLSDPTTLSGTVNVVTEAGNATIYSPGAANVTIHKDEITGTWTNVTQVDADQNIVQIDPADKSQVTLGGDIDSFSYTGSYGVDDGTVDFVYAGTSGTSRVSLNGVPANQQLAAVDANTGNILDVASSDGTGFITFNSLTNSQHSVLLQTRDIDAPQLSNSSPTGGLTSEPSTLEIDVNDTEFSEGDSVDVTISLDGTQLHTQTISSNQTVSTSIPSSGKTGGSHDWTVEAQDSFGEQVTETYSYSVPDTLYIRNATNHTQLIESPISVDGTFFGTEQIFERNGITDGTIDMAGLPVSDDYIVEVEPSNENLTSRSLYLDSIFQQESIYLLNTSAYPTIESRFVLDDPTGQYDQQSILFIQRPINISGNTTWQTVHSDEFGAEGVTATLEENQRYRIRVQNEQGDEQLIGPYRADVSETVTVVPGSPTIDLGEFTEGWTANAALNNDTLEYRYSDPAQETDSLTVWIHERGNKSNRPVANTTYFDIGNASASHTIPANQTDKTFVVNFIVDRGDEEFVHSITVSNRTSLFGSIPGTLKLVIGIGSLFVFAGAFSILNARIGAVVVALIGGLWWWIGLLEGATMGIAVVLALFLAALNWIRSGGGP